MSPNSKRRKLSGGSYEALPTADSGVKTTTPAEADSTKPDQRRSLFVRSLPVSVTTERLTEYFSESFPLKHATVIVDPQTKISKGFGFVTFADAEDAQAAIQQLNNSVLDGRKIKVELAQARHRDADDIGAGAAGAAGPGSKKGGVNTTGVQLRAQREQDRKETQVPRLIVRNLPWSIKSAEDLSLLFRSYGKVKHAVVPKKNPRVQYGFGIVVLRGKKNAEKALAGVNGKVVDGRTLAVDWAVDKETWEQQQNAEPETTSQEPGEAATGAAVADNEETTQLGKGDDVSDGTSSEGVDLDDDSAALPALGGPSDDEDDDDDDGADIGTESEGDEEEEGEKQDNSNDTTIFIRNVPFTTDDEILKEHFSSFGPIRYARVVYDPETERSKGTGFVCFFNVEDAKACVKDAPKHEASTATDTNSKDKKRKGETLKHSVLQNEASDPSGKYTLEGRVLNVTRALSRENAERRATEASDKRDIRDRDKRRLYLLSEGSVGRGTKLAEQLGKAEMDIRESSVRQRQRLLKTNPNLCLSLTRLSIRNVPRNIGSKELKALAREAVVGFAKDVKAGVREPLNREELNRGGAEMREADKKRKQQGKGIVRQSKVVFEDKEGSKVKDGAGRSRGYGFIEYVSHRNALAGLRWLNGHSVKGAGDRGKRLIVEFAIENAQVVQRRNEREKKVRELGDQRPREGRFKGKQAPTDRDDKGKGKKRKRGPHEEVAAAAKETPDTTNAEDKNRLAKRNRIIAKKRQARKVRKG
jgi:nucleolar protein 4